MNAVFPFGFPFPTAFYLTVFVLTLVLHVVFMNYVLAGTAYIAWAGIFKGGDKQRQKSPTALLLRDWMPFALSAAITAGVAPLLFIQILYKEPYYTANLLLLHRWMAILPVLIVAFYLCYVFKAKFIGEWKPAWRTLLGVGVFACIGFVAYSWTENHMLALQGREAWAGFYERGEIAHFEPVMIPRLAVLFFGAFPTLAMLAGWQVRGLAKKTEEAERSEHALTPPGLTPTIDADRARFEARRLAGIAFAGGILALLSGGAYFLVGGEALEDTLFSIMVWPWLVVGMAGFLAQMVAWAAIWQQAKLAFGWLSLATLGCVTGLLGVAVVREGVRLSHIDIAQYYSAHEAAARVGGLVVFLVFTVINAGLIIWATQLVRKGKKLVVSPSEDDRLPGAASPTS